MSLRPETVPPVPEETPALPAPLSRKAICTCRFAGEIGVLSDDADFADLFPNRGKAAYAPRRLALITIFQIIENLSDRAASDAVRAGIDWKYALSHDLEDSGFDSTARVRVPRSASRRKV